MNSRMTKLEMEAMNNDGASAVHFAAAKGHTSIVRMLIQEKGVNINLQGRGTQRSNLVTPLHLAVIYSKLEVVTFLLSQPDCDPSIMDSRKQTPLFHAVIKSHSPAAEKILRLLLAHPKTDVNHGESFHTPFQEACYYGELWAVEILAQQEGIRWGHEKEGEDICD